MASDMIKMCVLVCLQSGLLAGGQVLLKIALKALPKFVWSWDFFKSVLTDWWFAAMGVCFGLAALLWFYILKHYPFSQAYPLTSVAYIFGMVAAILVFGEEVPAMRWIGVALIIAGCFFIMK